MSTPDAELIKAISATLVAVFGGGGIWTVIAARKSRRDGVAADARKATADAGADWAGYAKEIRQALAQERADSLARDARWERESAEKTARLNELSTRIAAGDEAVRARDAHVVALEAHINARLPPPPPARPYT